MGSSEEYGGVTRLWRAAKAVLPKEDLDRYMTGVEAALAHLHGSDRELFLRWQAELMERQPQREPRLPSEQLSDDAASRTLREFSP